MTEEPKKQISNVRFKGTAFMSNEEFQAELMYRLSLSAVKSMLKKGLVTEEEYHQADTILLKQYNPVLGTLLAGKTPVVGGSDFHKESEQN